MLGFWILRPEEKMEMIEGCLQNSPGRSPEFSIEIEAFHLAYDNGLENIATDIGLSYFEDALLSHDSCSRLLDALILTEPRLSHSWATIDICKMKEFFSRAVKSGGSVAVVCD